MVGSVNKAFYQEPAYGKQYKYRCIERAVFHFKQKEPQFMDWLLAHSCYMDFSETLPEYLNDLEEQNLYHSMLEKLAEEVWNRLLIQA